jgi:hypothetical protein
MDDAKQQMLAQGLNAEGQMMGHCVGSYCEQVSGRGTRIFSLRDPQGKPHVTVEVNPYNMNLSTAHGIMTVDELNAADDMLRAQGWRKIGKNNWRQRIGRSWGRYITPEEELSAYQQAAPRLLDLAPSGFSIRQIKGKQNAAPVEQYLPYVQDFVKNSPLGGSWGEVSDLQHTGLKQLPSGHYVTKEEYLNHPSVGPDDWTEHALDRAEGGRVVPPEGHAEGGHIHPQHVSDFVNFLNAPEQ